MTFTEAAAHVLRLVGKPLHYKEITDVAIERDLLSHVGKSPEVTMGARLAAVVKKDPKESPLVRVKPGVFALRDWDQAVIDTGLADRTPALERLAKLEVTGVDVVARDVAQVAPVADADDADADPSAFPELGALDAEDEEDIIGDDERARAELAAAATELFVPEEDDDEPILGGGDTETETADRGGDSGGKRRRRRRRRGGRTTQEEESGLPSYTVSDAPLLADADEALPSAPPSEREAGRRPFESRSADAGRNGEVRELPLLELRNGEFRGDRGEGRGDREVRADGRGDRADSRGDRGEGRSDRGDGRGDRGEGRRDRGEARADRGDRGDRADDGRNREPRAERLNDARGDRGGDVAADGRAPEGRSAEDLGVPAMLGLLEQLLPPRSRTGSIPLRQLAEQGQRRVRGKVDVQALQDALADAVRWEVVRARTERRRARYALQGRAVSNTDWGLDPELVRLEKELLAAAARHREAFQRGFGERLQSLPPRALGDFFTLLLLQIGFDEIQPVRRQGAHNQELHLSAVARAPSGDVPTAIIIRRDGRDIGRERVIDLRGALHHYAGAQAGLLITTGQVLSGAREEAGVPNAAPVSLFDGAAISKLSSQHGVGVAWSELRLPMVDVELLESLTAN